jgi:site-specific recombinase XerD
MSAGELNPISPRDAVEMYLDKREDEVSDETWRKQRARLNAFVQFCEESGIENLNELDGRDLHRYRTWRKNGEGDGYGEVNMVTVRSGLSTLRVFLEFAASIEAVEQGMRERVMVPDVDAAKDEKLDVDRGREILNELERFHYASREHVEFALIWTAGLRLGTMRALDVGDFDADEPCLEVRHRPETGTRLKNAEGGERDLHLSDFYARVIEDFIRHNRREVEDEHGREPLLTTAQGRISKTTIRSDMYQITQSCHFDNECPHGEEPASCKFRHKDHLSKCPSVQSPHNIRRAAITRLLQESAAEAVSGRVDASLDVIDEHYDKRTEREKMRTRRGLLKDL